MSDVHSPEARRRNMAAIPAKDTAPELLIRRSLHAAGFRYRLHDRRLPGRPDIVLPKHRAVILVNGCFFHGHDCRYFKWPMTRAQFGQTKIAGNRDRDRRNVARLLVDGWRVLVVWECALRGDEVRRSAALARTRDWLRGRTRHSEIRERVAVRSSASVSAKPRHPGTRKEQQ
jgi:DNA mismatch endonuclease, patch repair protein